jgi:hypothetical protein
MRSAEKRHFGTGQVYHGLKGNENTLDCFDISKEKQKKNFAENREILPWRKKNFKTKNIMRQYGDMRVARKREIFSRFHDE